jgi:hypothetical protein
MAAICVYVNAIKAWREMFASAGLMGISDKRRDRVNPALALGALRGNPARALGTLNGW